MSTPTLIDLCAGCGGMTVGFVDAGFSSVLAVEVDRAAASTYATTFGEDHTFYGDIVALPNDDIPAGNDVQPEQLRSSPARIPRGRPRPPE